MATNELKVRNKGIVHTTDEWTNSSNSNYKGNATLNKGELAFTENDGIVTDMKIGDGSSTWGNLPYYLIYPNIKPIIEKTYTGVTCTANSDPAAYLYFGNIVPDSYTEQWEITYRIYATIAGSVESNVSYVTFAGIRNGITTWTIYNSITNGSYRAFYNHIMYRAKEAGVTNHYGHALGLRFYSSWNPNVSANARTIKVEIMDMKRCSFTIYDSMLEFADIPGTGTTNYDGRNEYDGTSNGFKSSGDNNDTTTLQMYYTRLTAGTNGLMQYSLCMMDSTGKYQSFTTNSGTGTTKTVNSVGFSLGEMFYLNMSGNITNGNLTGYGAVRPHQGLIDIRYSINCGTSLTANKMVYLVGTIKDGLFFIDRTSTTSQYTQDLPTSANGKVYIPLGVAYDTYRIDFSGYLGIVYHNGSSIVSNILPPLTQVHSGDSDKAVVSNTTGKELKWRDINNTIVDDSSSGDTSLVTSNAVYNTLQTEVLTEKEEPTPITANWNFQTNTPSTMSSVNIQGTNASGTMASDATGISATVNAATSGANIKLQYNSSGYAQFNTGTRIRIPVRSTDDVVTVVAYPGQYNYTVGGTAASANTTTHTATSSEVSTGFVDIVATGTAYLYSIKLVTAAITDDWFYVDYLQGLTGLLRLDYTDGFKIKPTVTDTTLQLGASNNKGILRLYNGSYYGDLVPPTLTANRTWTLPDSSGTIATQDYVNNYVKNGLLTLKVGTTQIGTFSANQATSPTWTINKTHITNLGIEATDEKVKFNATSNGWYKIPVVKNMLLNNEITTLLFNDNDSLCTYTSSNSIYLQLGDCLPPVGSENSGVTSQHKGILRIYNGCYVDFSANTLTENQYAYFPNHSGTLAMIDSWTNNITSEDVGAYLSATIQINGVNKYIYAKASGAITEEYNSATGSTRTLAFVNQDGNNPQNILFNRGLTIQIKDGKVENNVNTAGTAYLYLGKKDTTNGHQEGQFRLFGTNGYYVNVRTLNLTSDVAITLPNETSTLAPLLSDYVFLSKFPSGKNFNEIATYGNGGGYAVDVTSTDSKINPPGTIASDDYTFLNLSYKITGQSAYYLTQIVNKAGTTDLWVRSRNGSAISDSTAWAAPWTRILKLKDKMSNYNTTSTSTTNKIKININTTTRWMLSFVVTLYQGYRSTKIMVSGYNYGNQYWYSPKATIIGDSDSGDLAVYFGYDGVDKLWVGFDAGQYIGVKISDVTNGYNEIPEIDWNNLFTVTNVASLGGTTQRTVTAYSIAPAITSDTGTSSITLASAGKYKLSIGGKGFIFTMPTIPTIPNHRKLTITGGGSQGIEYNPVGSADQSLNFKPGTDISISSTSGEITINHGSITTTVGTTDTPTPAFGGTFDAVKTITVNNGHITGYTSETVTIPDTTVDKNGKGLVPKLPNETTTYKFLRQDATWNVPTILSTTEITVKTGSTSQSHITLDTLMTWLITTKKYIPSNTLCYITLSCSWNYANNDILQFTANSTNYELQLAGCKIEFIGKATNYNTGEFRLIIHSSPTVSFTVNSGYTQFPASHVCEYFCNGSGYSPTWKVYVDRSDLGSAAYTASTAYAAASHTHSSLTSVDSTSAAYTAPTTNKLFQPTLTRYSHAGINSSNTAGGVILSTHWTSGNFDSQLFMGMGDSPWMYYRGNNNGTLTNWKAVGLFTATPTSAQVVITDGTTGGIKSSGYTIATSVPSGAVFTDTKVRQSLVTTDANYRPLLLSYADEDNTTANVDNVSYRDNKLTYKSSTGKLKLHGMIWAGYTGTVPTSSSNSTEVPIRTEFKFDKMGIYLGIEKNNSELNSNYLRMSHSHTYLQGGKVISINANNTVYVGCDSDGGKNKSVNYTNHTYIQGGNSYIDLNYTSMTLGADNKILLSCGDSRLYINTSGILMETYRSYPLEIYGSGTLSLYSGNKIDIGGPYLDIHANRVRFTNFEEFKIKDIVYIGGSITRLTSNNILLGNASCDTSGSYFNNTLSTRTTPESSILYINDYYIGLRSRSSILKIKSDIRMETNKFRLYNTVVDHNITSTRKLKFYIDTNIASMAFGEKVLNRMYNGTNFSTTIATGQSSVAFGDNVIVSGTHSMGVGKGNNPSLLTYTPTNKAYNSSTRKWTLTLTAAQVTAITNLYGQTSVFMVLVYANGETSETNIKLCKAKYASSTTIELLGISQNTTTHGGDSSDNNKTTYYIINNTAVANLRVSVVNPTFLVRGNYSFATGNSLLAYYDNQLVIGQWNAADNNSTTLNGTNGKLFVIGNGTPSARKNVLTVSSNGQIQVQPNSVSWNKGRDGANLRQVTFNNYSPMLSMKTSNGSWELGTYTGNILHFSYILDTTYNGANNQDVDIQIKPDGTIWSKTNQFAFVGDNNHTHYETILSCTTEATTAAKVVAFTNFVLQTGARIIVKFTKGSAEVASPTLNVNSTGAKTIYYKGAALANDHRLQINNPYEFIYNGTQWELVGECYNDLLTSRGYLPYYSGTDVLPYAGLYMSEVYSTTNGISATGGGYPITFGNIINVKGNSHTGAGQLLLGWTGDTSIGQIKYRSKRDVATTDWSDWCTIYTTANKPALTDLSGTLAVAHGGTGATTAEDALTNLGLGLTTLTKSVTFSPDNPVGTWYDTGISGTDIPSNGTYIVQVTVPDSGTVIYAEMFSGVMTWRSGNTNSTDTDEIHLHQAGHASKLHAIYLRTVRQSSSVMKLQIAANFTYESAISMTFKFRKMI